MVGDDSQITCGWVNLLSPRSSVHRVATQGVARVNPRPTLPAQLVLLSACLLVVRPVGHIDALSNLAAFMLNLVNSSSGSRKDFQWSIFVCHMPLTGQTGRDIPAFDYNSDLSNDVAATVHVFQPLAFSWDFPSDPVILSSTSVKLGFFFFPLRVHPCLLVSLPSWVIMPKLTGNVFLIICFYWKPWFPVLPPHL